MTPKIKIVVSDTARLYPPLWGGPKRIWHLYNNLPKDKFDIDYVGIDFGLTRPYQVTKIASNMREFLAGRPAHYCLWHPVQKMFFSRKGFDLFTYLFMQTAADFTRLFTYLKADVLIASHPWAAPCMKKNEGQIFIYDAHNCEFSLMRAIIKGGPQAKIICSCVKRIEKDACAKADVIFVCSQKEKEEFINLYQISPGKLHIIPNGALLQPCPSPEKKNSQKKELGFLGRKTALFIGAYYKPNIDAARHIIYDLAPQVCDCCFLIAGNVSDAFKGKILPENVKMFGQVTQDFLNDIITAADIAINPMFEGSGINIKVLDYLSGGLPLVSTEVGARGISYVNFKQMIVCDIPEFPRRINQLFSDNTLYQTLVKNGRSLVENNFDWKDISKQIAQIIEQNVFRRGS